MLRGGLAGLNGRGGLGSIDQVPQPLYGWDAYRRRDPGGALQLGTTGADDLTINTATPVYVAGLRQFGASNVGGLAMASFQGGGMVDALYAIPQPLPDGKLIRILWACNGNAPASGSCRLMLYRAQGGNTAFNLYPKDLVYDSGNISFAGLGIKSAGAIAGGVTITAGLYFFVVTCDALAAAGGSTGAALAESTMYPVNGCTVRYGNGEPSDNDSQCIGWRHDLAFGSAPSTFPTSAPRRLAIITGATTMPALYYGFDPDLGR